MVDTGEAPVHVPRESSADLKRHSEAGIRELGLEREKIKGYLVHLNF